MHHIDSTTTVFCADKCYSGEWETYDIFAWGSGLYMDPFWIFDKKLGHFSVCFGLMEVSKIRF